MDLLTYNGNRPKLKVLNDKIYLQKFNYVTKSNKKRVSFSSGNLKQFFSNQREDFLFLMKKTRDPDHFPQLIQKIENTCEYKKGGYKSPPGKNLKLTRVLSETQQTSKQLSPSPLSKSPDSKFITSQSQANSAQKANFKNSDNFFLTPPINSLMESHYNSLIATLSPTSHRSPDNSNNGSMNNNCNASNNNVSSSNVSPRNININMINNSIFSNSINSSGNNYYGINMVSPQNLHKKKYSMENLSYIIQSPKRFKSYTSRKVSQNQFQFNSDQIKEEDEEEVGNIKKDARKEKKDQFQNLKKVLAKMKQSNIQQFNNDHHKMDTLNKIMSHSQNGEILTKTDQQDIKIQEELLNKKHNKVQLLQSQIQEEQSNLQNNDATVPNNQKCKNNFKFYQTYRKINQISEQNEYYNVPDSLQTSFLKSINKSLMFPKSMGLFSQGIGARPPKTFSNLNLSQNNTKLIATTLSDKFFNAIQEVKLQNCKFEKEVACQIVEELPIDIKRIDLRNIGDLESHFAISLSKKFLTAHSKLISLNLEGSKLDNDAANMILKQSILAPALRILNMSLNNLTDQCGQQLEMFLQQSKSLEQIYLHWNKFKGSGGHHIFQGLMQNQNIRVCDLSNNQFNIDNDGSCVQSICSFLKQKSGAGNNNSVPINKVMHLDLSRNQFSLQQSKLIADALSQNNSIIGFHFQGNQGIINPLGFLVFPQFSSKQIYVNQRIEGVEKSGITYKGDDLNLVDNCWICEGWEQHTFEYAANVAEDASVYLHLDFLDYQGIKMLRIIKHTAYQSQMKNQATLKRFKVIAMCPPKRTVYYFFSVPKMKIQEVNPTEAMKEISPDFLQIPNTLYYENGALIMERQPLAYLNYYHTKSFQIIDCIHYIPMIQCLPRISYSCARELTKQHSLSEDVDQDWDFKHSVWKFSNLVEEIPTDQFESEIELSNIKKIVNDEQDYKKIKLIFNSVYQQLKLLFKTYSAYESCQNNFVIFHSEYSYFIAKTSIVDNKFLKVSDVDSVFHLVKSSSPENQKGLNMSNFMECLVRLAQIKYIAPGFLQKTCFALKELLDSENFLQLFKQAQHPIKWRKIFFWNQKISNLVRYYWPFIQIVFNYYSTYVDKGNQALAQLNSPSNSSHRFSVSMGSGKAYWQRTQTYKFNSKVQENKKWLLLANFHNIFDDLEQDMNEIFLENELNMTFSLSIDNPFIQKNEIYDEDDMQNKISITGFFEALARLSTLQESGKTEFNIMLPNKNDSEYKNLTLDEKLENMILILYRFLPIDEITEGNLYYESILGEMFEKKGVDLTQKYNFYMLQQPQKKHPKNSLDIGKITDPLTPQDIGLQQNLQFLQRKSVIGISNQSQFAQRSGKNQIQMIQQVKKSVIQEAGSLNQFLINSSKQNVRDRESKFNGEQLGLLGYENNLQLLVSQQKDSEKRLFIDTKEIDAILEKESIGGYTPSSNSSGLNFRY